MLDATVKELVQSHKGFVLICAGSGSDAPHIEAIGAALERLAVPYRVRICSAHKQVDTLMALVREINAWEGSLVYIAVAGGTDALSGVLSYHAMAPVVSCPPDAPNESCLHNPSGSSNATVYKSKNAARFAAQVFAGVNPAIREALLADREQKIAALEEADRQWRPSS